jgi:hypothetical protein
MAWGLGLEPRFSDCLSYVTFYRAWIWWPSGGGDGLRESLHPNDFFSKPIPLPFAQAKTTLFSH